MKKNAPEIMVLRNRVENAFGRPVNSPAEFEALSDAIFTRTGESISPSTLKRLWGYVDGVEDTRRSTLHILSVFSGYGSFEDFCQKLRVENGVQSDVYDTKSLTPSSLQLGDRVEVSWPPNRYCTFEYLGGDSFRVVTSVNSKLLIGDSFCCQVFIEGAPLYLTHLMHAGKGPSSYVAGRLDGLTRINVLSNS